jgi:hypothetical protein
MEPTQETAAIDVMGFFFAVVTFGGHRSTILPGLEDENKDLNSE